MRKVKLIKNFGKRTKNAYKKQYVRKVHDIRNNGKEAIKSEINRMPRTSKAIDEHDYIGIDTLSTYCITNNESDLIQDIRSIDENVTGISSTNAKIKKVRVGVYYILDDLGMKCKLLIPEL
jgi:N-methylhydantoinase B/oxoprolinase/acetone carboxylase alpha subunit